MRILEVLTYYRPHVSGLTIYVERLAKALAEKGHQVTVLTSQYDRSFPREEMVGGVRIVRVPVVMRVSKGVIMPTFGLVSTQLFREHDVVHLHLPQFDAPGLAIRGRLMKKPVVLTYHCDLRLPPGPFNRFVNSVVLLNNWLAGRLANAVVAYTEDYARHSHFLSKIMSKVVVIPPPVIVPSIEPAEVKAFRNKWQIGGGPVIGMAARLATEKGAEVLLSALPRILEENPQARVLFAGPYKNVLGEETYAQKLQPLLNRFSDHWTFVGSLDQIEMAALFSNCDVTVLPSLNSTESFGLVQIEGMLHGVPAVASNLPGVRQPVRMTGMGEIAPVGDAAGLADSILNVLRNRPAYSRPAGLISQTFSPAAVAGHYESLFGRLSGWPGSDDVEMDVYARLRKLG